MSTSRLTRSPGPAAAQRGAGEGLGDQADGEPVGAGLDDGEADAVHGDRALVDQVAAELGRHRHVDDLPVLAGRAGGDDADAVDVTLDDVAAEPGGRGDRALEVDLVARLDAGEAGLVERLLHDVGGPRVAVALGDGQAAAVDGDRVAQPGVREDVLGMDGEPDGITLVLDPGDGAELLDDPGEHQLSPGCMVRRTFGCSPSRPSSTVTSVTTGRNASAIVVIPRSATAERPAPSSIGAT